MLTKQALAKTMMENGKRKREEKRIEQLSKKVCCEQGEEVEREEIKND